MYYALGALLAIFLIFLFMEMKRKAVRIQEAVQNEKRSIAEDSGMTAVLGIFTPDIQTTVVIGASEELGIFYYRMLRQSKVIIRSRINLANLSKTELLINGNLQQVDIASEQPTTSLRATEISDTMVSRFSPDSIRQIERVAMRVIFYDDAGLEKTLDITTFRAGDERQRFERVSLLKNTIWWVAFLQMASRQARQIKTKLNENILE